MSCRLVICQQLRHLQHAKLPRNRCKNLGLPSYMQQRASSNIWPISDFFSKPSMFSLEAIKKHQELVPLVAIIGVGMACEFLYIVRQAFTRDDVRYCPKKGLMAFERNIDKIEKGDKPPIRKCLVFNQKYEYSDDLVDALAALREPTEEEKAAMEAEAKKKKK